MLFLSPAQGNRYNAEHIPPEQIPGYPHSLSRIFPPEVQSNPVHARLYMYLWSETNFFNIFLPQQGLDCFDCAFCELHSWKNIKRLIKTYVHCFHLRRTVLRILLCFIRPFVAPTRRHYQAMPGPQKNGMRRFVHGRFVTGQFDSNSTKNVI